MYFYRYLNRFSVLCFYEEFNEIPSRRKYKNPSGVISELDCRDKMAFRDQFYRIKDLKLLPQRSKENFMKFSPLQQPSDNNFISLSKINIGMSPKYVRYVKISQSIIIIIPFNEKIKDERSQNRITSLSLYQR